MHDGKLRVISGQDWEQDANDRDLSINSMSIDSNGTLYDYTDGLADLRQGVVRMLPYTRSKLAKDPHLIMRWFKALGYFDRPRWPRQDYDAIKRNMHLLDTIRTEEKTDRELSSIMRSANGQKILQIMCHMGADRYLGINCTF